MFTTTFRAGRLALHLCYGMSLALIFPRLARRHQQRIMQRWSIALLAILHIERRSLGEQNIPSHGCLMVANHVSWLDIFVLNAEQPARFIAKSEVRDWPLIGWLCQRTDTLFIERAARRSTSSINQQIIELLQQGEYIGLFPEGTTTDGKQVGHFHSALLQPAIAAGASLQAIALRYVDEKGNLSVAAAFTGDTTLMQSIWAVLRCPRLVVQINVLAALQTTALSRRALANTAQQAIAQALSTPPAARATNNDHALLPRALLSAQSAYVLLLDPILKRPPH